MCRQVCIIEPSFFKTTSGMHRRPFEGRHLVLFLVTSLHETGRSFKFTPIWCVAHFTRMNAFQCVDSTRPNWFLCVAVPSPPLNLTVTQVWDREVGLSWLGPRHPNGEISGYRVYFMRGNITGVRTVKLATHQITYNLTGLGESNEKCLFSNTHQVWEYVLCRQYIGL